MFRRSQVIISTLRNTQNKSHISHARHLNQRYHTFAKHVLGNQAIRSNMANAVRSNVCAGYSSNWRSYSTQEEITPIELTSRNFKEVVQNIQPHERLFVKFEAEWCTSCQALNPKLTRILNQVNGLFAKPSIRLGTVDVDNEDQLPNVFQLQSLPTLYSLKGMRIFDYLIAGSQVNDPQLFIFLLKPFVEHDAEKCEFFIDFGNEDRAVLRYEVANGEAEGDTNVAFTHVIAPPRVRGNYVGDALAHAAFQFAESEKWKVKPVCPWIVEKFLKDEKNRKVYEKLLLE